MSNTKPTFQKQHANNSWSTEKTLLETQVNLVITDLEGARSQLKTCDQRVEAVKRLIAALPEAAVLDRRSATYKLSKAVDLQATAAKQVERLEARLAQYQEKAKSFPMDLYIAELKLSELQQASRA